MVIRCLLQGSVIFAVMFASYYYLIKTGNSQELASTFAFTTLIFANVLVVYVLQSDNLALENLILDLKDKVIVLINSVIIIVLMLLIYVPFLSRLIGMTPLSLVELLVALGLAIMTTFVFDLFKLWRKK